MVQTECDRGRKATVRAGRGTAGEHREFEVSGSPNWCTQVMFSVRSRAGPRGVPSRRGRLTPGGRALPSSCTGPCPYFKLISLIVVFSYTYISKNLLVPSTDYSK